MHSVKDVRDVTPEKVFDNSGRQWKLFVGNCELFKGILIHCAAKANQLQINGCKNIRIEQA